MERTKVVSSQIASIGYEAEKKVLEVEFVGRGGVAGSIYHYVDVEPEVHAALMGAESIGKYFNQNLRDRFKFHKFEPDKPAEEAGAVA